jgi:predicted short-subunit dehydrogenase-like oxidoreductase (DUF2520 family)
MEKLNFIGCGAVGRTLGRLFHQSGVFEVQDILTRSLASARSAAEFLGAGRPVAAVSELRPARLYLIAVGDDGIAGCAAALAGAGPLPPGSIVCHLSGALPSSVLAPVAERGGLVASVHPVLSFADPRDCVASFPGTWCGVEGDAEAVACLSEAFAAIGGNIFSVDARFKTLYHTGSVLVCNYLTALVETGIRAYGKGGLSGETALRVMEPLVRGTLDNIFRNGTQQALTGPIARGDCQVVSRQLAALDDWDSEVALVYRSLGRVALQLSRRRGAASEADLARLQKMLEVPEGAD